MTAPPASHNPLPTEDEVPTTLPLFAKQFPTDEACAAYLFRVRYPDGYACPECGSRKAWKVDDLWQMICDHGHRVTVTSGTVMHRSRQPLTTWFYAAYLVSTLKPGISALQFQVQLGIGRYETAFQMLHKLRSALVDPEREPLKGEVEVDEAYIGGPEEGRPGRGAVDKAMIVVAVEVVRWTEPEGSAKKTKAGKEQVRAGRCRISVIPDGQSVTLVPWVQRNVAPGSAVWTDGNAAYNPLTKLGYTVEKVFASHHGIKTGDYLPLVHLIISNLKRWLMGTHKGAVLNHHLQAYLNEFTFRFNRRYWRGPAFLRVLGMAVERDDRPEYDTLYGVRAKEAGAWVHPNPRPPMSREDVERVVGAIIETADAPLRAWLREHLPEVVEKVKNLPV